MKCIIKRNDSDEYEVPTVIGLSGSDAIYYTDDREDAIGTAELILGKDVEIKFVRGTYDA